MSNRPEIKDQIVQLDYQTLQDTIYRECKLVFKGGRPPIMTGCDFIDCEFILEGEAMNTLFFLGSIAHSGADALVVNDLLGLKKWALKDG